MRLTALLLLAAASSAWAADRAPNIVFILADDLGRAELGCYGQKKIRTPEIDRLAAEGMRFKRFYAGSPVCAPSRCVLLTGRHNGRAAVRDNREAKPEGQFPLPAAEVTVAERLKARGYATACIGKWGLGMVGTEGDPNTQGFDLFYGYNCQRHAHNHYPTYIRRNAERIPLEGNPGGPTGKQHTHDLMEAEALKFVRDHKDRPFFLYLPFAIPHVAIQVPDDSLAEYKGKWDDPAYTGGKGYLPHPAPRAGYAAMVTRMDRSVGRLTALLKELDLDGNTVVFFSSDNGPTHNVGGADSDFFESAGGLRGLKGSVFEGGLATPMIVRWPGRVKPESVSDWTGAFCDVLPTLCDIAGAEVPAADTDGISFLPTLLGRDGQKRHEFLYWEFPGYGGQQAVRLGDWKGVRTGMGKGNTRIALYDLTKDPAESDDVAARHPDVVARIAKIMAGQHVPSKAFPIKVLDGGM